MQRLCLVFSSIQQQSMYKQRMTRLPHRTIDRAAPGCISTGKGRKSMAKEISKAICMVALMLTSLSHSSAQQTRVLGQDQKAEIASYLKAHWQTPENYIVSKFQDHDVVLLAEHHGFKHNLELIQRVIPQLYKAGVYNIGMEFGAAEDQAALDRLVNADTYDEDKARELMFDYNVGWAYKEYMDVYRKAWEFNKTLPPNAPRFRIVNLSYRYDWNQAGAIPTSDSMERVFYRGNTETFRADVVDREIYAKHQKMLILTGSLHAFTKYLYPEYDYYSPGFVMMRPVTFGNLLETRHPGRNFTIFLHIPWTSRDMTHKIRPLGGVIDDVMSSFNDKRIGFDTHGSPFASLIETSSSYAAGYPQFTLETIADGYIYEKPFDQYEGCTIDEKFLTDKNWPVAKEQMTDFDVVIHPKTRADYMQRVRNRVDMKIQLSDVLK